jgi:mannose-1-phosphate guanylyltransferase
MIAVIMAGGAGTRFWPASRASLPKQFLPVLGDKSMIRLTFDRLTPLIDEDRIYVVTAASQAELVREHLPQMPVENIIIEPFGMNTAPCIALSVARLSALYPAGETMLVLPADHFIQDTAAFLASLSLADHVAKDGRLVTFGIVPTYPATGYGYIEAAEPLSDGVLNVSRFKEKPDYDTATFFLSQGNFYWNSGMFGWTLATISQAFDTYLPQALAVAQDVCALWKNKAPDAEVHAAYANMPKTPIDIGVMEPATNRAVIPVSYGWSDVGSWKALADLSPADADGNRFPSSGMAIDAGNNYAYTNKFTAFIGVNDLCVVETPDAILVVPKDRSEEVKAVVDALKHQNKDDLL